MPSHNESRPLPFSAEQMYALVADVARYPEFLPWVAGARVRSDNESEMIADLIVGFKGLREQFTSRVLKTPSSAIDIEYLDGPLKQLNNAWRFRPHPDDPGCYVDFHVAFQFRNTMFERLAGQMFNRALFKMTSAFVDRAYAIYGDPVSGSNNSSAQITAL